MWGKEKWREREGEEREGEGKGGRGWGKGKGREKEIQQHNLAYIITAAQLERRGHGGLKSEGECLPRPLPLIEV